MSFFGFLKHPFVFLYKNFMYPFQNAYIRKMYLAIDLGWEYLVLVAVGFAAGFINTLAG